MHPKFANRMKKLEPAAVYEILKRSAGRDVIPFGAGNPSPDSIPHEQIAELAQAALKEQPILTLQYGLTEGYSPLRAELAAFLKDKYGIGGANDQTLITSGATQAIELCTKAFCNEKDVIITENPTFVGALATFDSYDTNIIGVSMEPDGMNMEELERVLAAHNARFIYVVPNFHNPTGWTMSLDKRKRLYELALKYGTMILEDDPYRDLRYSGDALPSLKSMDTEGIVLYAGSFSKIISPGLRVGFLVCDEAFADKIASAKQVSDVHTPLLSQMIVYGFMQKYGLENHIAHICGIYRKKLKLALDCLDKHMGNHISYIKPDGGLYIFCKLPDGVDTMEFFEKALEAGVAVVYGSAFNVDPAKKSQYFRINFSAPSDEQLQVGIEILGQVLKRFIKN